MKSRRAGPDTETAGVLREATRSNVVRSSGINAALGLWLIVASSVLGYSALPVPFWNELLVGMVVVLLATVRTMNPLRLEALSWGVCALGIWLVGAPILLPYPGGVAAVASWNSVIVGIIVVVLATRSAMMTRSMTRIGPR